MPFVADPGGIGIWTCVLLVTALPVIGGIEDTFCGFGPEDTCGGRDNSGFTCKRMLNS